MQIKNKNGQNIYLEIHGKGEPIFLLHHGFGCTQMWKNIYPSLVENGFQTILFDRRGYGNSEFEPDFFEYYRSNNYRSGSVDEVEQIRLFLGLEKINIVGQCEGGVIGVDYSFEYPEHTNSLVISSTLCHSQLSIEQFNAKVFPKVFNDKHPEFKEKFIRWHSLEKAESLYNQFRIYGGAYGQGLFDIRSKLKNINCPVLVLYPDRSSLFEVEQAVDFYRNIKNSELAILPGCGHNAYEEQPEEYTKHLLDFMYKHPIE